ncbi:hypothetical protein SUDANB121_01217 [Nocardiopsis dassonvillei]|uniref:hypothetical protein n=1 Tax=Nocardiopsis dassonvillei TaxID=2014 RepID=UPI003F5469E1
MPDSTYHQIHFAWAEPTLLGRVGPGPAASSLTEVDRLALRAWRNRLQPALTVDYRVCLPDPADHPETLWARAYDDGQAALVYRWPGDVGTAHAWAIVGPADGLTLPRVLSLHENPNTRPHRTRPPRPGWGTMPVLDTPEPWERSAAPGAVRARDRRAADLTAAGGEELLVLGVAAALERPDLPVRVFLEPGLADLWNAVQLRFLWGMHRSLYEVLTPRGTSPAPGWDWSLSTYDPVLEESGQHIVFGPPTDAAGPLLRMPGTEFRRTAERLVGVLRDEGGDPLGDHLAERGVPDAPTFEERRGLLVDWLDPRPAQPSPRTGDAEPQADRPSTAESGPEGSRLPRESGRDRPLRPGADGPRTRAGSPEGAARTRPFVTDAVPFRPSAPESPGGSRAVGDDLPEAESLPADSTGSIRHTAATRTAAFDDLGAVGDDLPAAEPLSSGEGDTARHSAVARSTVSDDLGEVEDDLPAAEPLFMDSRGLARTSDPTNPGDPEESGDTGDDLPGAEPLSTASADPARPTGATAPTSTEETGEDRPTAEPLPNASTDPVYGTDTSYPTAVGDPEDDGDDLPQAEPLPPGETDTARDPDPTGHSRPAVTGDPIGSPRSPASADPTGTSSTGRPTHATEDPSEAEALPVGSADPDRPADTTSPTALEEHEEKPRRAEPLTAGFTDTTRHTAAPRPAGPASTGGNPGAGSSSEHPADPTTDGPDRPAVPIPGSSPTGPARASGTGRPRGLTEPVRRTDPADPAGPAGPAERTGPSGAPGPGRATVPTGTDSPDRPAAPTRDSGPVAPTRPWDTGQADPPTTAAHERGGPGGPSFPTDPGDDLPEAEDLPSGPTAPDRRTAAPAPVDVEDPGDDLPEVEPLPGDTGASSFSSPFPGATRARDLSDDAPARAWASREAHAEAASALPEADPPGAEETGPQAPPEPAAPSGRTAVETPDPGPAPDPDPGPGSDEPLWPGAPAFAPGGKDLDEALWPSAPPASGSTASDTPSSPSTGLDESGAAELRRPRIAPARAEPTAGPDPESPTSTTSWPGEERLPRPPRIFDAPEPHEPRRPRIAPADDPRPQQETEPPVPASTTVPPRRSPSPIRTGLFRKRNSRRDTPATGTPRAPEPEAQRSDGRVRALAEGAFGGRPTRSTPEPPGPDEYPAAAERTPEEAPPLFPSSEPDNGVPGADSAADTASAPGEAPVSDPEPPSAPDYATETAPGSADPIAPEDNWPTQYADLPLDRLERWLTKYGPEEARIDLVDARAAVRAERSELRRVREERDHYHAELQDSRREVARLDRSWIDREDDDEPPAPAAGRRRWPGRVLVLLLLFAFLATGLEAGARFGVGALDLLAGASWWPF